MSDIDIDLSRRDFTINALACGCEDSSEVIDLFGGIEEIGWRYFFQPTLQEKIPYLSATVITFLAWSSWHLLYFYIDGSLAVIQLLPFLVGLLTNCFILSALYHKTQNLWICVMTHACINSLSQILVNEEVWLSIVSKILIISLAIMLSLIHI